MERFPTNDNLQVHDFQTNNFFAPFQTYQKTISFTSGNATILNSIEPWEKQLGRNNFQQTYQSSYSTRGNATAKQSIRKKIVMSRKNSLNQNINYKNNQKLQVKADTMRISFKRNTSGKNNKYREQLSKLMNVLQVQQNGINQFRRIGKNNPENQKVREMSTKFINFQDKISSSMYCYPQSPRRFRQDKNTASPYKSQNSKGSNNLQKILKIKEKIRKRNHSKMMQTKGLSKTQILTLVAPQSENDLFNESVQAKNQQKYIFAKYNRSDRKATLKISETYLNQMNQVIKSKNKMSLTQGNIKFYEYKSASCKKQTQKDQMSCFQVKKLKTLQFWKAKATKYLK